MNDGMLNIGYSCYVSADKVVALASPDSSPIKRLVQEAKDKGALIDCTYGQKNQDGYSHGQRPRYTIFKDFRIYFG